MTPAKLGAPARDPALGLGGRPFPYRAPAAPVGALALLGGSRCLRRGDRARGRPARPGGARRVRARAPPLRGEFLKGEFFTWLEPYRMDYRRRLLDAARSAGAMAEGMGDAARAVAFHRAILEREPTDEDAARGLMRCLARCGDVAGARTAFEELSQALVDELDDPACGRRRRLERCWRNWSGPPRVASASGLQTAGPGRRDGAPRAAARWHSVPRRSAGRGRPGPAGAAYAAVFGGLLVLLAWLDLGTRTIPNAIVYPVVDRRLRPRLLCPGGGSAPRWTVGGRSTPIPSRRPPRRACAAPDLARSSPTGRAPNERTAPPAAAAGRHTRSLAEHR